MNVLKLAFPLLLVCWSIAGMAADRPRTDQECSRILEDWARSPKSVPKRVADACKAQLAAPAPAAEVARVEPMAALDPCMGPNAAGSVQCWGPWASLAPAAAAPITALEIPKLPSECSDGTELSSRCIPRLEPVLPVGSCTPGTPCGFATIVSGVTSNAEADNTVFAPFAMAQDGSQFTVDPGKEGEIASVTGMGTTITPRGDGYQQLNSRGRSGDQQSRLVARVTQDDEGQIILAADVWSNGNRSTGAAKSGYFAWGIGTSQSALNALNAGNVSVSFAGPMSVNNATMAAMTLDFGSKPTWTGTWTNPAWSFGAGGTVSGANLISTPDKFTANVVPDVSFVQGALLGETGKQGIAHIIDVTLTGSSGTHIKDVGLLRQIVPNSIVAGP